MASLCLCKPPLASEPASHVKPVTKQTFGRVSPGAACEAAPEVLPNRAVVYALLSVGHAWPSMLAWPKAKFALGPTRCTSQVSESIVSTAQ